MPHKKNAKPTPVRKGRLTPSIRRSRVQEAVAAALLTLGFAMPALAVELGEIRVHSWIGEQIKASIPLAGDDASGSEARCFKGVLVNLHGEPVSALKLTLQHMTTGSVLLLFGGSAVDEPAATVVVENVCGTGGSREYAVLLDQVPASQAAATPARPDASARDVDKVMAPARKQREAEDDAERIWIPDTIYPIPGMPPMRMASMLGSQDEGQLRRAAFLSSTRESMNSSALLRLDRAFDKFGQARHGDGSGDRTPWIAALSAVLLLGAAGWIVMRIRAMRAAAKPWLPIDDRIDAGSDDMKPAERLPS